MNETPPRASLLLTLRVPNYEGKDPRTKKLRMLPCVLSWNNVLQLEHNARQGLKKKIQNAFLSALRAAAADSSMKTTSAKSTWSTAVDTLVSYQATVLAKRKLRCAKKKLEAQQRSAP